ncbi:MAG: heterodisulfide reductase-related iron-sulfur binding cluster, partial [Candidatus Bathyarchaeota archaeon]|nr:heterodisulfide reductase-related iron-sulfur binding cluster [Candidatus Bathyarchaeota archaeon]
MSDLRYLFFIGCTIPYRVTNYEVSARKTFAKLGIELVEMSDFNCCGLPVDPASHEMMMVLAARNLCLAEQQGLDIITLCTGCAGTLRKVNRALKEEKELRSRVNEYLSKVGM